MNHAEQYLYNKLVDLKDKLATLEAQEQLFLKAQHEARADLTSKIADLVDALEKLKPAPKKTAAKR